MFHKIIKYIAVALGVVGVIFLGRIISAGDEAIETSADLQNSLLGPYLSLAYVILGLCLVFVIAFVIKGLLTKKGELKHTLLALGGFLLVVAIAYFAFAEAKEMPMRDNEILSASGAKWVDTGLYTFYIMGILAIITMAWSGTKRIFKKS